jgi:hypothetical protein
MINEWKQHTKQVVLPLTSHAQYNRQRSRQHQTQQETERRNRLAIIEIRNQRDDPKQQEYFRLMGYYSDSDGNKYYPDEMKLILSDRKQHPMQLQERFVWHMPEAYHDYVNSIGEIVVPKGKHFHALNMPEGTVVRDPKIRHVDRAVKEFQ